MLRKVLLGVSTALFSANLMAAEMQIRIDIPAMSVAEYHRPYVAVWIEKPDESIARHVAVWYDQAAAENKGTKWLKDLRLWWRKGGRELQMPMDGMSSATRQVGQHQLRVDDATLRSLASGEYRLVVEAAREKGGREFVKIPFRLPVSVAAQLQEKGSEELGMIQLSLKP
ncbi:DUF2271 domain-containing protein [Methylobacillus flagellatus]|uniref:DUF2271 domain-containing protein n=1 Tax=Methylobacillus flagellatus TaxID=405 RepID=UPI001BB2C1FE|nr:DUF2271 domain-containing protein [Methylobacillus flagellatus]